MCAEAFPQSFLAVTSLVVCHAIILIVSCRIHRGEARKLVDLARQEGKPNISKVSPGRFGSTQKRAGFGLRAALNFGCFNLEQKLQALGTGDICDTHLMRIWEGDGMINCGYDY